MTWTNRLDTAACCPGSKGAVDSTEDVALYLHSKIDNPDTIPFERKRLTGEDLGRAISNVCGDADGVSVDRAIGLSEAEILVRAKAQAERQPDRVSTGAKIALVSSLRDIRRDEDDASQVVFVYDDPLADNDAHAVIRLKQGLHRAEFNIIRRRIIDAFSRRVA